MAAFERERVIFKTVLRAGGLMRSICPYYSAGGYPGNDSALVPFIHKHHGHGFQHGPGKKNGTLHATPIWRANQEEGAWHLVGMDGTKWDIPRKHYNTFLRLLFEEPPQYTWFFIEPMYDVHKMYMDFDFKTPAPVDYTGLVELVTLTCELVHTFFNKSAMSCCVATCTPYVIKGKGLYKSGLHLYFNNVVTNSVCARKCRRYVVQELQSFKTDPDYNIPREYDWGEVIDEKVFEGDPGSMRGALRLNNTYKVGYCKQPACVQKKKAVEAFRAAKGETKDVQSKRARLSHAVVQKRLGIPDVTTRCCTDTRFADGQPYGPWLFVDELGHRAATYASTQPYTNWSIMVDLGLPMSPFDASLAPPEPPRPRKLGTGEPAHNVSRVDKKGSQVTLWDSKTMGFINEQVIQKLAFKSNPTPEVCSEYRTWVSKQDGYVRPYRNAYASKVVAIYTGQDKGHVENECKNFVFHLPLLGEDRHNCYGGQHCSNQAKLHLVHRSAKNNEFLDLTVTCYKRGCQFRPPKPLVLRFVAPEMHTVFRVLMQEAAGLLGLRNCRPLPSDFRYDKTATLDHRDGIRGGRSDWPVAQNCPHTTFDFMLEDKQQKRKDTEKKKHNNKKAKKVWAR